MKMLLPVLARPSGAAASKALAGGTYVSDALARPASVHVDVRRRRKLNGLMMAAIRRYQENEDLVD